MSGAQDLFDSSQWHFVTATFRAVVDAAINWAGLRLEPAVSDASGVFGLAQFLSTLALLVVVFNVADFRYRYRLLVRRYDVRKLGILISGLIAIALLVTEFWFQNSLVIPHFLNHYGNIKIVLAGIFIALVLYVVTACFLRPAVFRRSNAMQFFRATNHYIHQGNKDRLQAIAEELNYSIENIFKFASKLNSGNSGRAVPVEQACAHDLLLTIADRRFCNLVVERTPSFAIHCFVLAEKYPGAPFTQFARNVGEEFIVNTGSAFYQEDSGYNSGYFGYSKPITSAVFGSYKLIERCASERACPLDLHYTVVENLDARQMEGFTRAGLSFFGDYLVKNHSQAHSYALARLLDSLRSCANGIYRLNDLSADGSSSPEYARFRSVADFAQRAIEKLDKSGVKPRSLRPSGEVYHDVYDAIAHTILELISEAATVNVDPFVCWNIQHNIAWKILFSSFNKGPALQVLRFKVRRLIYDQFTHNSTNFLGARYIGFCLNVCGLTKGDRHEQFDRDSYALRVCVINWTKKNYRHLLAEHPNVARACLHGSVKYDQENHQITKTFSDATRKELPREVLVLD